MLVNSHNKPSELPRVSEDGLHCAVVGASTDPVERGVAAHDRVRPGVKTSLKLREIVEKPAVVGANR